MLKLAPTGKARVKMGPDAKTLAQFLIPDRYDSTTGVYKLNPSARKVGSYQTVIVDEASMLTEEQLAALFDSLGSVKRIVLVGDYRQLPPIGTGRPFVDIVRRLKPSQFPDPELRVAPAYAELIQIHRQSQDGGEAEERIDVQLSRCFGDQMRKEDLAQVIPLLSGHVGADQSSNLKLMKWYESSDLREKLKQVLKEELELRDGNEGLTDFQLRIGATQSGRFVFFNRGVAEKALEDWQILSPVNGYGYGVKEINKFIQTAYRQTFIDLALNLNEDGTPSRQKRRIAKPKGADNIVYGDKVINLRNTSWAQWQKIKPTTAKDRALNYIANGEIGIVTGEFRSNEDRSTWEPNIEITFSTQQEYSYVFQPNQIKEEGQYPIELAYCISVHKAQGSGFKKVFFILPSGSNLLSRELMYTALTRQVDQIIILHQGEFRDFFRFASDQYSETAKRYTNLFDLPELKVVNRKRLDSRYINVCERGELMISKNEVIIANSLYKYERQGILIYSYEDKLKLRDDLIVTPDFRIQHLPTGRIYYWEHLGMMTQTQYRHDWERKLAAYRESGFVPHNEMTEQDQNILIITEENPNGGIDSQYFDTLIRQIILGD